jgi:hypothetical protein
MTQQFSGTDYINQPLIDAWWTPGWTAQNDSYIPVPPNTFTELGYPPGVTVTNVTGSFFDVDGNPISGYFTFFPSSDLTFTVDDQVTYMPARMSGVSYGVIGFNNLGDGRNYLDRGRLSVYLVSTDNPNMYPASFFYHVKEHSWRGREYDISVPFDTFANGPVDIHSLIMPPVDKFNSTYISSLSTEPVSVDVSMMAGGLSSDPTSSAVQFAFVNTVNQPASDQWVNGTWAAGGPPYVAQILQGPSGGTVNLPPGRYAVWIKIITSSQVPVRNTGTLVIY